MWKINEKLNKLYMSINCSTNFDVRSALKDLTSSPRYFPVGIKISEKQTVDKSRLSKSWFTCSGEIKKEETVTVSHLQK